jgi:hypothetical protein
VETNKAKASSFTASPEFRDAGDFFIGHPAATLNERQKRVIDLGREGDDFASFKQKTLVPVKPIRSKIQAFT